MAQATAQVISVNPAVKTRGELMASDSKISKISRSFATTTGNEDSLKSFLNTLLGISNRTHNGLSSKMLAVRLLCGAWLIATSAFPFTMHALPTESIIGMSLGLAIGLGLLTRPASLAGAGWYIYSALPSLLAGDFTSTYALTSIILLSIGIIGPGRFSLDQVCRYCILRISRRNRRNRKRELKMDYRAYIMADRRVS